MAANTIPIFPLTPRITATAISTAVTTRTLTGVGSAVLAYTAGSNGTRVDSITICATATTTVGVIRFWYYIGSGNALLWQEVLVTALTPSTTVAVFMYEFNPSNWILPTGSTLYVSPHNAEAFNIIVRGGDY